MGAIGRKKIWFSIRGPLFAVAIVCLAGCQRPEPPEDTTSAQVVGEDLEYLWDAALSVLAKHDFRADRQDRASGVIETLPTTSQHWSEFWRQDVADAYSLVHGWLHTTQRKATVRFVREEGGWRVDVQVDVYRLTTPESQITTASSALQAFSGALPTTEGRTTEDSRSGRRWVHLGRDAALETRLLQRILR
jgi:hypothetical protein